MRTTLTIEESIFQQLKQAAHKTGFPLKKVVNKVLEIGLRSFNSNKGSTDPYQSPVISLGNPPKNNLDKALQLASRLEDTEIQRKLELKK